MLASQPNEHPGSDGMTAVKHIEYGITRQLLRRREQGGQSAGATRAFPASAVQPWADRVIAILAVTSGLLVVGSYMEELLWAVLAAATFYSLR